LEAWKVHNGQQALDNIKFVRRVVPLHQEETYRSFRACMDELPSRPALIVFDTLAAHLNGADENSLTGMGAFVSAAERLRYDTGAAVLLVAHAKDNGTLRGHTSLPAAADRIIKVTKQGSGRIL